MMKRKLAVMLWIFFFAPPLAAGENTGTLQGIERTGLFKIGYRTSQPPMSFLDEKDNPAGYSIDLCKCIADEVEKRIGSDLKVVYIPVNTKNRFQALADHRIDILCGSTTKTLSRSETVDFTQLTYVTGASLLTMKDHGTRDPSGFDGKKIGVIRGTTTADELGELIRETSSDAQIVLFKSSQEGIGALRAKKIDAFSADQIVLIGLVLSQNDPANFVISPGVFSFEPFALAVRRNDADFRLVADRVLSDLYRSKKIFEIYDKWVGSFIGQRPPLFDAMIRLNATPE